MLGGCAAVTPIWAVVPNKVVLRKKIPTTGESIACLGMGTWITFNVGTFAAARENCRKVTQAFFQLGGQMIDSSPMYGSADAVIGHCLQATGTTDQVFCAPKIWTSSTEEGREQHERSLNLWGVQQFDLQQIHNLRNVQGHLKTLQSFKAEGRIRYLGITTSHGRRHREVADILKTQPLDFVQLTYNITHPQAEYLIDLAHERGIAVIANRPLDGGRLMDRFKVRPLPRFARDAGVRSWSEYFLKWIVSKPGVTVAIPATSKVEHMRENGLAMTGEFFDAQLRNRLQQYILNA